jgi:triacylglycerol lipase
LRALLALTIAAAVLVPATARAGPSPTLPANDPFYKAPAALGASPDGAILRTRQVKVALAGGVPLAGALAYQLLYRTNDGHGRAVANVTTVIVPAGPRPARGRKLVSLQDAEDSLTSNCAPSYQLRIGERNNDDMLVELNATAPDLVTAGRVMVIPDPEGPQSEVFVRTAEARAVLDSIRAVEHFDPAQLSGTTTPVGLVGYSGGGNETLATAELQHSYAPELNVVGVAAGGAFVNDRVADEYVDSTEPGVVMVAMIGLERAMPDLGWSKLLNTYGRGVAKVVEKGPACVAPMSAPYRPIRAWSKVKDLLGVPAIARAIAANAIGGRGPRMPTYLYVSGHDQLISPSEQDHLAARYCAAGTRLDYYRDPSRYPVSDHLAAAVAGFVTRALVYLNNRFAGRPAPDTCL